MIKVNEWINELGCLNSFWLINYELENIIGDAIGSLWTQSFLNEPHLDFKLRKTFKCRIDLQQIYAICQNTWSKLKKKANRSYQSYANRDIKKRNVILTNKLQTKIYKHMLLSLSLSLFVTSWHVFVIFFL